MVGFLTSVVASLRSLVVIAEKALKRSLHAVGSSLRGRPRATCNRVAACAMISRRSYPRKGCSVQTSSEPTVVRVRLSTQTVSKQGLPGFVGVSADTVGAEGLSLKLMVIPQGGKAT